MLVFHVIRQENYFQLPSQEKSQFFQIYISLKVHTVNAKIKEEKKYS